MAPEIHEEQTNPATAVDIFSFGIILYELLTRTLPFSNQKLQPTQIVASVLRGKRPLIPKATENEYINGCPEGYIELMKECWAQDPKKDRMSSTYGND